MEKDTHFSKSTGAHITSRLAAMFLLGMLFQGVTADEQYQIETADFEAEIKQQGALALQEMTRDLKQNLDWGKRGAKELEITLKQQTISSDRIAGNALLP